MSNLANILVSAAAEAEQKVAIKMDRIEISYGVLDGLSRMVSGLLRSRKVQPGDRVALISPNIPPIPAIYYGILRYGAVVVPLDPVLKAPDIEYHLKNAGATLAFVFTDVLAEASKAAEATGTSMVPVDAAFAQLLSKETPLGEVADVDDDDAAVIFHARDMSGRPEGREVGHGTLHREAESSRQLLAITTDDVIFAGLPFHQLLGQSCALNACAGAGAMLTILPKFDPVKALQILQRDQVSIFLGVPAMCLALTETLRRKKYDVGALRLAAAPGTALPLETIREFESSFDVRVVTL